MFNIIGILLGKGPVFVQGSVIRVNHKVAFEKWRNHGDETQSDYAKDQSRDKKVIPVVRFHSTVYHPLELISLEGS